MVASCSNGARSQIWGWSPTGLVGIGNGLKGCVEGGGAHSDGDGALSRIDSGDDERSFEIDDDGFYGSGFRRRETWRLAGGSGTSLGIADERRRHRQRQEVVALRRSLAEKKEVTMEPLLRLGFIKTLPFSFTVA